MANEDIVQKYKERLEKEFGEKVKKDIGKPILSREYKEFKRENLPRHLSLYERACNFSEKVLNIKPDPKKAVLIQENINICHLECTPTGTLSFSILFPLLLIVIGSIIGYSIPILLGEGQGSVFFVVFFLIAGASMITPLGKLPDFFANTWRLKASNQMVLCIFYIVTYMRHTPNLENAVQFSANHLAPPLSVDLKKVLWDVESGKYESVKDSVDHYLESWRKWNLEFIEAFHLVESSLYEGSESRRLDLLDKSLDIILDETYEKMLHYAQNLKSPITILHMLGIILPILGLVILPLVVSFMDNIRWYHIFAFYNVLLPISVYYLGKIILSKRPTGYGDTDISEENPELKKYKNHLFKIGKKEIKIHPGFSASFIGVVLFLLALSPVIIHKINPSFDIPLTENFEFIGYRCAQGGINCDIKDMIGPFGLGAAILSIFFPLSFGLGVGYYFSKRSKNVIKIREKTEKLEQEFASALFQLGNRLGDGLPAEIAFSRVADTMQNTHSGDFFKIASNNITRMGMDVEQSLFDKKVGALVYFPSKVIESSMKVLLQSVKKGPKIAANALMNVARYIKEIHKVNERLKDLLADIISSMKSQIAFLTPVIAGIVVGITSMITTILGKLGQQMENFSGVEGGGPVPTEFFGSGIPTYYFQIIVGIYVVQIVYILTILANGVENGSDKLNERFLLGRNLVKSTIIYCVVSLIVMILFNLIAGTIMAATLRAGV